MANNTWGKQSSPLPGYGPTGQSKPEKDPFHTADITGSLIVALAIIGIIVGLATAGDDDVAGVAIIGAAVCFAALGLILSAVGRIGTGLWEAGHIK
jgi:hypothetical protein